jgi:hypothetical protein
MYVYAAFKKHEYDNLCCIARPTIRDNLMRLLQQHRAVCLLLLAVARTCGTIIESKAQPAAYTHKAMFVCSHV